MNEFALVHPWTQNWWRTLPVAYQSADAQQFAPPGIYQVGLNLDPTFQGGAGGWVVTAVTQDADKVAAKLERTFLDVVFGKDFNVQVWWSAPVPGAYLTISIFGQSPTAIAETTLTEFTEQSGLELVTATATPGSGNALTVRIELGGLVTPDKSVSLLTLDAINVTYLPVQYEALSGIVEDLAYPLLRFMDGPGRVAGQMREISDQAWTGDLTNPDTTPDHALPWLAQMLGTPVNMQNLPLGQLRQHLQDMKNDGRPAVGTRSAIITAARQFLTDDKQALIPPTGPGTPAHTIVMLVRSDQVPDGNLQAIETKVRATGVIPAGHVLSVRMARSSWDGWEAAAGITWDDVEANTRTWAIADSLGIELEPEVP